MGGYFAENPTPNDTTTEIVGFNMLPINVDVDEELDNSCEQPIAVDYSYNTNGDTLKAQSLYFQDGNMVYDNTPHTNCGLELQVVGQYTNGSDIAISFSPFDLGVVAVSGPHIEADVCFCESSLTRCEHGSYADTEFIGEDDTKEKATCIPGPFIDPQNKTDPTNGYKIGKNFLAQLIAATPDSMRSAAAKGCSPDLSTSPEPEATPSTSDDLVGTYKRKIQKARAVGNVK